MVRIFSGTDQGKVRVTNQDAYVTKTVSEHLAYAVVCDGMGGENGGQVASERAIEIIGQALDRAITPQMLKASVKPILISAITAAGAVIFELAQSDEALHGMGTTVVAAVIVDDTLCIAHTGDSRAYLIADDEPMKRLTRDHSVVQLLVESGEITEDEARIHPKRNFITRALGVEKTAEPDYTEESFEHGRLLICTDGLYNYAPPEEHVDLINTCESDQDIFLLIDEANKAGGPDNITAVIMAK